MQCILTYAHVVFTAQRYASAVYAMDGPVSVRLFVTSCPKL